MESAQRESITGLGRRPQWAERGPGKPLCVKTFKVSDNQRKQQIRLILCILHTGETSSNVTNPLPPSPTEKLSGLHQSQVQPLARVR